MQTIDISVDLPDAVYDVLLNEHHRFTVLKGGRGSGKSHSVARALILQAMEEKHRILCTREIQRSIKDSVHRLLSDVISAMGVEDEFTVLETEIRGKNGSLILFSGLSTQTIDSIKSLEGVTLVWVEEAQSISERSWAMLIPTIRAKGSRFILTMNPMLESDPTSQRFLVNQPPSCKVVTLNFHDNPWFPAELEQERKYHLERDPETYAHVWEGAHLPAVEGAVFFREMQAMEMAGRIRLVPIDPLLPVHTVWDIGIADNTAITLAQVIGSEVRVVGYIQDNNRALSSYVQELGVLNYRWGDDFVPHDAFHRDFTSGTSAADMLQMLGRSPVQIPNMSVEEGIKLTRETFPRVYIDSSCGALVECLKRYRWHTPQGNQGQIASRPFHDEFSHGADSFRYLCIASRDMRNTTWGKGDIDYSVQNRSTV